jgi:hypothetical protein
MIGWALTVTAIMFGGAGLLILIDILEDRRRRKIQAKMETFGRKRVGL